MNTATVPRFVRADGPDKVTGSGRYTADLTLTGMLAAKFRYADVSSARITHLDVSAARQIPGVFAVLTADDLARYFESDLLFYRAAHPEALVAREAGQWDPVLFWVADTFGARFVLAEGIVHVRQPEHAVAAVRAALPTDPWSVAAAHVTTTITGSALLALALLHGARDLDQVWAAANVDEDWNIEQWGLDSEAAVRRAGRLADLRAAALVLDAMRSAAG